MSFAPPARVEILLSTFNGKRFLQSQMDSILSQNFRDWKLIARDDGSTDATPSILAEYAARDPERIVILKEEPRRLGICASFARLMSLSFSPYIVFSDQDDIWLPQKIETLLKGMIEMESRYGAEAPLLVHSDMGVIDDVGRSLSPSAWNYQHLSPETGKRWTRLTLQNVVTGCAMMINRALKDAALPIPPEAIIHDWWLALTASMLGRILPIPEVTTLYRQHGGNAIGARKWSAGYVLQRAREILRRQFKKEEPLIAPTLRQSRAFFERYEKRLNPRDATILKAYIELGSKGFFERRLFLIRHHILKTGWARNIALFWEI